MKWHIETRKVADLKGYEHNPRQLTKKGLADLKKSIDRFGLAEPIVVNLDGTIIGGHARTKVLDPNQEVEVYLPDRLLTEQEYKELNVRLNKNIAGEWDFDVLANHFDLPDLMEWGFDEKDLKFDLPVEEDEAPEVDEVNPPVTQLGDIYQLGEHRLMCGDSTDTGCVSKLMDGKLSDLILTDPPYNVDYEGGTGKTIANDNMGAEQFKTFLAGFYSSCHLASKSGASIYVAHSDKEAHAFRDEFEKAGFHFSAMIVWAKNSLVLGRGDYHSQHEPIIYGWKKGGTHYFTSDRGQTTLWNVNRPSRSEGHPTMKPVELCARAIKNSSKEGDVVLDLFGGSGSTLIACEQLDRKCYMMELDPRYCDVIVKRWEQFTGEKAEKLNV